jgi:hypothetical protein
VFYTNDHRFGFQKVGMYWSLYDGISGEFIQEFRSFTAMVEYIIGKMMEQ